MAVEFRNASWWNERNRESTLAFEREHGLVNVVVDGPQGVGNSVPTVWEVTSPELAIIRMHGRNHETWNRVEFNNRCEPCQQHMRAFRYARAMNVFTCSSLAGSVSDTWRHLRHRGPRITSEKTRVGRADPADITVPA